MHIRLFDTRDDVASAAAQRIADALRSKPDLILGLPAGQTPVPVYAELRRLHASGQLDFSRATCFTIDEFVGLDRRHRGSFHAFVSEHLFSTVNVDPARVHSLDGAAMDVERECERYEAAIAAAGGIDLQMLGLGSNGHVGFNEPGETLVAGTHRVTLLDETRRNNAGHFGGDVNQVPREALSMGMGTILKARAILMSATGELKAKPVEQMVRGPITTRMPASFLQLHSRVELCLDRLAGSRL